MERVARVIPARIQSSADFARVWIFRTDQRRAGRPARGREQVQGAWGPPPSASRSGGAGPAGWRGSGSRGDPDALDVVVALVVGAGHHFLGHRVGATADRCFEPCHQFGVFGEEGLRILATLPDADRIIAEPGARFLDEPGLDTEVENLTDLGNALAVRSEEHTSELQSLMRISYAGFCVKQQHRVYRET